MVDTLHIDRLVLRLAGTSADAARATATEVAGRLADALGHLDLSRRADLLTGRPDLSIRVTVPAGSTPADLAAAIVDAIVLELTAT